MRLIRDINYMRSEFGTFGIYMLGRRPAVDIRHTDGYAIGIQSTLPKVCTVRVADGMSPIAIATKQQPQQQQRIDVEDSSKPYFVSSHVALVPVLVIAQIFAVMPMYGVRSADAAQLKFVWLSGRMVHSGLVLVAVAAMSAFSIARGVSGPASLARIEPIMWFVSKLIIIINFTLLARRWPQLMTFWESVEGRIQQLRQQQQRQPQQPRTADDGADTEARNCFCQQRIKWYTISITFIIFVEHSMSIAAGVYSGTLCKRMSAIEGYFSVAFTQLYDYMPWMHGIHQHGPGNASETDATFDPQQSPRLTVGDIVSDDVLTLLLVEFINFYCVFLWSFMDVFVVAVSLCLTLRFRQQNVQLKRVRGRPMSSRFWADQREMFIGLVQLTEKVDDSITSITTLSVSNNLYFMLIQLLHVFQLKETYVHTIYFWFSLLFLISRTLFVTLHAARLNEESKLAIPVLRSIPTEHFHPEAQRFLEMVINSQVSLTGMRFFYLNRTLILSMAGTVVTYELVLIQFRTLYVDVPQMDC